jgi:hypothetical protein
MNPQQMKNKLENLQRTFKILKMDKEKLEEELESKTILLNASKDANISDNKEYKKAKKLCEDLAFWLDYVLNHDGLDDKEYKKAMTLIKKVEKLP